jgi:arsenate reductase
VIQIFGTAKCKQTRAAERFFKERAISIHSIDLAIKGPSKGELESVARAVGGMKALFDPASPRAKEKGLHVAAPTEARLLELFLEEPRLLRTPIVRDGAEAAVGEAAAVWKKFAERAKGR